MLKTISVGIIGGVLLTAGLLYIQDADKQIQKKIEAASFRVMGEEGSGTAFFVYDPATNLTALITARHVCEVLVTEGTALPQLDVNGFPVSVIITKMSKTDDLCALIYPHYLKQDDSIQPLILSETAPNKFDSVYVGGFPGDLNLTVNKGYFSGYRVVYEPVRVGTESECDKREGRVFPTLFGFVCAKERIMAGTTTQVYPGHSGSAVVNSVGEVIGVAVMTSLPTYSGVFVDLKALKRFLYE